MDVKGLARVIYGAPSASEGMIPTMRIGKKIKALRIDRGMKQGELARRAGVKVGTLSDLENGYTSQPRGDTLVKLAAALNVEPDSIMAREGIPLTPRPGSKEADLLRTFLALSDTNRAALLATAHALMDSQPEPEVVIPALPRDRRGENGH